MGGRNTSRGPEAGDEFRVHCRRSPRTARGAGSVSEQAEALGHGRQETRTGSMAALVTIAAPPAVRNLPSALRRPLCSASITLGQDHVGLGDRDGSGECRSRPASSLAKAVGHQRAPGGSSETIFAGLAPFAGRAPMGVGRRGVGEGSGLVVRRECPGGHGQRPVDAVGNPLWVPMDVAMRALGGGADHRAALDPRSPAPHWIRQGAEAAGMRGQADVAAWGRGRRKGRGERRGRPRAGNGRRGRAGKRSKRKRKKESETVSTDIAGPQKTQCTDGSTQLASWRIRHLP